MPVQAPKKRLAADVLFDLFDLFDLAGDDGDDGLFDLAGDNGLASFDWQTPEPNQSKRGWEFVFSGEVLNIQQP